MTRLTARLAALALAAALPLPASADESPKSLTIGDPAPSLDIEHWISTGSGFDKVTSFEPGRVYVVEFWATWCGPCIASMPALADLQEKYADKGVQIVSISDESLQKVEKFLDRKLPGVEDDEESDEDADGEEASDEPKTYGELTSVYTLTTDPDGSVNSDYMDAAFQNGIPCCFIVGKSGQVEWIGHPMLMKQRGILDDVLDGSYDRDAFKEEFEESQKFDRLQSLVYRHLNSDDGEAALEVIRTFKKENPADVDNPMLQQMEMNAFIVAGDADALTRSVMTSLKSATNFSEAIGPARALAAAGQQIEIPKESLTKVAEAVGKYESDVEGGMAAYLYDTKALLMLAAKDYKAAIAAQEKAVEAAKDEPRLLPRVKQSLERIKEASGAADSE